MIGVEKYFISHINPILCLAYKTVLYDLHAAFSDE